MVLVDELVAYIRQFQDGQPLSGGSYDSNMSFVQSLTEAAKMVANAVILASLRDAFKAGKLALAFFYWHGWRHVWRFEFSRPHPWSPGSDCGLKRLVSRRD